MADGNHDLKRGIILDVDGTLWDAVEVITQSWNVVLNTMPDVQGEISADQMRGCLGKTMFEIADRLFGYLPLPRRRQVLEEAMRYEVAYLREHPGRIYPGVRECLKALREDGWHLYIVYPAGQGQQHQAVCGAKSAGLRSVCRRYGTGSVRGKSRRDSVHLRRIRVRRRGRREGARTGDPPV